MDQHLPTVDEWLSLHGNDPDPTDGPHLISVEELRAAGALDVPASWRKSLGNDRYVDQPLFADLDDDSVAEDDDSALTDQE
jgi:hypothetical protein